MKELQVSLPTRWMGSAINVALIGVGGTGSEVLDGLARLHCGLVGLGHPGLNVLVVDGDKVSRSNIGRQRFSPMDVGEYKAVTLVTRYNLFYGLNWRATPEMIESGKQISHFDWVISCVDSAESRRKIRHKLYERTGLIAWLDIGNDQHKGQAVLGLKRNYRDHPISLIENDEGVFEPSGLPDVVALFPELDHLEEPDQGPSCSLAEALDEQDLWVNKFASMSVGIFWNWMRKGHIKNHGMFFDAQALHMKPLPIDPQAWEWMAGIKIEKEGEIA